MTKQETHQEMRYPYMAFFYLRRYRSRNVGWARFLSVFIPRRRGSPVIISVKFRVEVRVQNGVETLLNIQPAE